MKKRLTALACTLALLLALLAGSTTATGGLFFLGLNDTLVPQSSQTTPIQSGGWVYVPVTAFNSRVTGVNFGVYYGFTENNESLIFYNLSGKNLTFNLTDGTATAVGADPPVPSKVIARGGIYYVPAYAVCRYFGLTYSFETTEYGPLLRIKDSKAVLGDALFINSTASMMRSRYNAYLQSIEPPPTVVVPPKEEEEAPKFSLYVGVRAAAGSDLTAILNGLSNVRTTALVFFPAESVADCADQIRQAAGRGHRVGLIPGGDTPEARLASVEQASALVEKILRQEVWFVLGGDQVLTDAGYLCWSPGLNVAASGTATQLYDSVVDYGDGRSSAARILLDSRANGSALANVLAQLYRDGDTFLVPRETRY